MDIHSVMSVFESIYLQCIGSHCSLRKGSLEQSLEVIRDIASAQVFLSPPMRYLKVRLTSQEIKSIQETSVITPMYCHAPYYINLCNPYCNRKPGEVGSWVVRKLKEELTVSQELGFQGVVFHVGKSLKMPSYQADSIFRRYAKRCLKATTPECPLLIETPSGQGSELYTKVEDFATVFIRLNKYVQKRDLGFGVCVDTCHVFASGYDPYDYITRLEKLVGIGHIKLIHLNNSKGKKGSCVDRHNHILFPGGQIPDLDLLKVVTWAVKNKVDMVTE